MLRFTVYFSGRVQGVGFRYTARNIAMAFVIAGTVQNLDDGRVLLIAEGAEAELMRFVDAVLETMRDNIRDHSIARSPATAEFGTPAKGAMRIVR